MPLLLCPEKIWEITSEKQIARTMVYLNDLFRNNHPSAVETRGSHGHVADIIPKYLALGQARKCFVGKNIEKKFLETMTISDVYWTNNQDPHPRHCLISREQTPKTERKDVVGLVPISRCRGDLLSGSHGSGEAGDPGRSSGPPSFLRGTGDIFCLLRSIGSCLLTSSIGEFSKKWGSEYLGRVASMVTAF